MTHPWFSGLRTPRVLAHRGLVPPQIAEEGVTENSFAAIAHAHAAGVHYVESDCHLTRDGVAVLFHDEDLARVTGDPRAIADVDVRELEHLMAPRGGLATVQQALESFPDLRFNFDVKADAAAVPVGRAVARHAERVLLTSFSDARRRVALEAARSRNAAVEPATSGGTATVARLLAAVRLGSPRVTRRVLAGVDAIQIPERRGGLRVVTPRLFAAAHDADVEVHVWTVNDPDDMLRLVLMGADGIVTDRADVALDTLHAR